MKVEYLRLGSSASFLESLKFYLGLGIYFYFIPTQLHAVWELHATGFAVFEFVLLFTSISEQPQPRLRNDFKLLLIFFAEKSRYCSNLCVGLAYAPIGSESLLIVLKKIHTSSSSGLYNIVLAYVILLPICSSKYNNRLQMSGRGMMNQGMDFFAFW